MISQGESDGGSRMSGDGVYRADRRFTTTDHQLPRLFILHAHSRFIQLQSYTLKFQQRKMPVQVLFVE